MNDSTVKAAALALVERLPDNCTWNDVMYAFYVRSHIDAGRREAEAGLLIDHDDLFRELLGDEDLDGEQDETRD